MKSNLLKIAEIYYNIMGKGENTVEHLIYAGYTAKCFIWTSNLILLAAIQ